MRTLLNKQNFYMVPLQALQLEEEFEVEVSDIIKGADTLQLEAFISSVTPERQRLYMVEMFPWLLSVEGADKNGGKKRVPSPSTGSISVR
jgi:hypothetical protein